MYKAKFRFKSFVSVSLPLPKSLPKRPLPKRATFDFMNELTPETKGLCIYVNRCGDVSPRRTKTRVPVRFTRYTTGILGSKFIEARSEYGVNFWLKDSEIYFIHEEEAREAA